MVEEHFVTIGRLGVLLLLALLAYALLFAKNSYRYFQFLRRYDYWIAGYLFDKQRSMAWRFGILMLWILAVFGAFVCFDTLVISF